MDEVDRPFTSRDWLMLGIALLVTVITFANGMTGDFVLDDTRQIVRNDLIRDPSRLKDALTRDIWAFHGDRDKPWSNYWRPAHVLWLVANYRVLGIENPTLWHVTALMTHLAVVVAGYLVLRRLGAGTGISAAIICLFAIHPTRSESVVWISGTHDVLCTLWQLLTLLLIMSFWRTGGVWKWVAAVVTCVLAVCTKEIAVFLPVIVALIRYTDPEIAAEGARLRTRAALLSAAPLLGIAIVFLVCRQVVLGSAQLEIPFQPSWSMVLATLPLVVMTYLRQLLFPLWLGWTYPVRTVHGGSAGLLNFYLPIVGIAVLLFVLTRMPRSRLQLIGLAIFTFTLMPALNLRAFLHDNLVKDRFLYLPLLGFLMMVVPWIAQWLSRTSRRSSRVGTILCAVVVALLATRTILYNRVWANEMSLWTNAVRVDPSSTLNHHQLAVALMNEGRLDEAAAELQRSESLGVTTLTYLAKADLAIKQKRHDDAVLACRMALSREPDNFRAYERLAVAYQNAGKLELAQNALLEAIDKVSYRRAHFADSLAVILYQQNRKPEAQKILELAAPAAETEFTPTARLVFFHLGMLYAEQGRSADAKGMLTRFLQLTDGSADPGLVAARKAASQVLSNLK